MPLATSAWPLLLCGPILRRVEPRSVSVFVALKFARTVQLSLFRGTTTTSPSIAQTTAPTVPLGRYLHVVVVTLTLTEAQALQTDFTYGYNLSFTKVAPVATDDTLAQTADLASLGLLGGTRPLGYAANELPSFALPPTDVNQLKLVHASCRLAHAEEPDAFPSIDAVIANTRTQPLERPHQLILTGDQIYADDVADALLAELTPTGNALLGWPEDEVLPGLPTASAKPQALKPGQRQETAHGVAKLTAKNKDSNEAHSHLFSLGEFYAMYLFVWSEALWPAHLQTFAQLFPEGAAKLASGPDPLLVTETGIDPFYEFWRAKQAKFDTHRARLQPAQPATGQSFREGIPAVRRLLANVPVYMAFDDHEVTDDWYLDKQWVDDVLGNALGTRVVANALAACAVFQTWGNTPQQFLANPLGNGRKLLNSLAKWQGKADTTYDDIKKAVRVPLTAPDTDAVRWDYKVACGAFQLIALDTRTHRAYPGGGHAPPDLMTPEEITKQLGPPPSPPLAFSVLVSPAPVFGHPFMEQFIQDELADAIGKKEGMPGGYAADREAWAVKGRPRAFESLIEQLSALERVVILAGDVHYGFTVGVRYWNDRPGASVRRAAFAHLVSSGLKNEKGLTRLLGRKSGQRLNIPPRFITEHISALPPYATYGFLGWPTPGKYLVKGGKAKNVSGTPAIAEVPCGDTATTPPQWRYRLDFEVDMRTSDNRSVAPAGTSPLNPAAAYLRQAADDAWQHRHVAKNDQMRTVVGHNNWGRVTFAANTQAPTPAYVVFHELWYRLDGAPIRPYTIHFVDLTTPDVAEFRPQPPAVTVNLPDLSAWAELVSLRAPTTVQQRVRDKNPGNRWYVHRLENALGPISLDYYPVRVTRLPTQIPDIVSSPSATDLLRHIRYHINDFIDTTNCEFSPYDSAEGTKWLSADPLGAVIHIDMKTLGGWFNPDDGSVVCSAITPQYWVFSTVWTTGDFGHPVSGNRMFGFVTNADGSYTFFTRGADRTTSAADYNGSKIVFGSAHTLWQSLQQKIAAFVNANGGAATVETPVVARYDWPQVLARYHEPTVEWLP